MPDDVELPGRDEHPEPDRVATQQDFGRELTRLRGALTIREVARASGLPPSTVGDYFAGRHLPPAGQPGLADILRACGETDPDRARQWAQALARARRPPGRRGATARPPYRGLASFQPDDAPWFFGRAQITARLVTLATEPGQRDPLVVVGPSGSGKSSLLRAGLIPALQQARAPDRPESADPASASTRSGDKPARPVALFTPAADPLADLAAQLAVLDAQSPAPPGSPGTAIVVVDQFEAVFADCADEDQREAFITAVCALAGRAVVVLALRSDFYDHALRYPPLSRALQDRQVVLGPMSRDEVRCAIVEPARLARLDVADGLVEVMLADLAPRTSGGQPGAAHEPGALPLLSHALLATWQHSKGGRLTVADYQATGGIAQAIAKTAEDVYAGLEPVQRDTARRLFLRLVHVGDDVPETRSTQRVSELHDWPAGRLPADDLLHRFVAARLITLDAGTAQISHDALLTAWPRLRSWIDAGRADLRTGRRIGDAARAWAESGRDAGALLRGSPLAVASDFAADPDNRASLSRLAGEFVAASAAADTERRQAERLRTQRLRRLVATLTALVVATCGLSAFAFQQREAAAGARNSATIARDNAESREVAIEADQARVQNPSLASQLSLAAYRITRTVQARSSLLESSGTPDAARFADTGGIVESVALSPDRRVLAVAAGDGTLRLWNVSRAGHPVQLGGPLLPASADPLYATALSPDGKILAAAGAARTVLLWNISDPRHPVRLAGTLTGPRSTIYSLAFSRDGSLLAGGGADGTVRLWKLADPGSGRPLATLTGPAGEVHAVAFSPGGQFLAVGSPDDKVRLWSMRSPSHPARIGGPLGGPAQEITSLAFSPDGQTLAAGSQDAKVWLWKVRPSGAAVPDGPPLAGATDWVNAVAFSPGGTQLAAGTSDGSALVWNLASRVLAAVLPNPVPVTTVAWSGTGRLIAGDAAGLVLTWALPAPVLVTGGATVFSVAYGPGGRIVAGGTDLQVWNPRTREPLASATPPVAVNAVAVAPAGNLIAAGYVNGSFQLWRPGTALTPLGTPVRAARTTAQLTEYVAFSPNGRLLATAADDGTIRLWDISDPARPQLLHLIQDSGTYVFSVAFRHDGRVLAAGSAEGLVRLWNIAGHRPQEIGGPLRTGTQTVFSVAFSPDGGLLAAGTGSNTVLLWNVADPARPRQLGQPLTGPSSYVYSVQFSPRGRMLAAGSTDDTAWLWDVARPSRPALMASLSGPGGHVYSVAFSPDGGTLAASSADGTVWLWDTGFRAAATGVCALAGQPLTRPEWASYVPGLPYRPPCAG